MLSKFNLNVPQECNRSNYDKNLSDFSHKPQYFLCVSVSCISANQEDEEEGRGEERANDENVRKEQEPPVDQTLYYEEKVAPILDEINRALTCGQSSLSSVCSALSHFSVLCFPYFIMTRIFSPLFMIEYPFSLVNRFSLFYYAIPY